MNRAGASGRPPAATAAPGRTEKMRAGRQADSARRRQRVIAALNRAATDGGVEISVAGIARAGVDRSFLYRHHDLLEKIHVTAANPPADGAGGAQVTRASLQADLLAAHERAHRLSTRIQQLERRLSQVLGEQVFRESGLGQPADIDHLQHQITHLQGRGLVSMVAGGSLMHTMAGSGFGAGQRPRNRSGCAPGRLSRSKTRHRCWLRWRYVTEWCRTDSLRSNTWSCLSQ